MDMENDNSKEINLLQLITLLFNWVSRKIKGVFNCFGYLIRLTYHYYFISGVVIAISLGVGLYLSRPSARIYKAEAMAMLYGTDAQTVKEICKQLENSISSSELYSLSAKLSIPDSVARNIVGFYSYSVIDYLKDNVADKIDFCDDHSLTDTLNVKMKDRLYFRVLSRNISQIPIVQAAILNYFNNNSVMRAQFDNNKRELLQEIKICDAESQRIDSLAKVSYFKDNDKQLKFDNNKLIVGEQRKQLFYGDLLEIQKTKAKAETKIINSKQPIDFPSGLVVILAPINGSLKYGLISIFIGYFISLILCGLIQNFKGIVKYLDEK
jgi:hypothetical protein